MPDFAAAGAEFITNGTLQQLYGLQSFPGDPNPSTHLINQSACEAWLGTGSDYYSWDDASGTINTWILPFTGLLLQAPFDSNDFRGTFWAIMRWSGGCMASLSYVLWNMRTTANCAAFIDKASDRNDFPKEFQEDGKGRKRQTDFSSYRDAFFLLSVMNQFTLNTSFNGAASEKLLKVALFSRQLHLPAADSDIEDVRIALARDTRESRKRGTVQCFLSMIWFIFGLVLSIQQAFGLLGQDAASHNLALGLNVIWFPVLILCTVVDRNPAIPEATQRQLNVFLGLVREALLRDAGKFAGGQLHSRPRIDSFDSVVTGSPVKVPGTIIGAGEPNAEEKEYSNWFATDECDTKDLSWIESISDNGLNNADFFLEFAGQGRKMWHYGAAHPIIKGLKKDGIMNPARGWAYDPDARRKLIRTADFDRKDRMHSWDMRESWQLAMSIFAVWGSCLSALIISYYTPTVGLGCRALGYLVFAINCTGQLLFEMIIWWLTPHHKCDTEAYQRWRFWGLWTLRIAEVANGAWLVWSQIAQVVGIYNTCKCKCSNYGLGGGYIDFNVIDDPNANTALPFWIAGTALGCCVMGICFSFIAWEWVTQSHMSSENYHDAMAGLRTTRRFKKWTKWLLPLTA